VRLVMPRHPRISPDGFVQHVLNRGDHRETLFHTIDDFIIFLSLIAEAACRVPMRILAYCIMRNHFQQKGTGRFTERGR
jgi:putative transposase